MGACVRVEHNFFAGVRRAVMMEYSPEPGAVQLIGNHFGDSDYASVPTCILDVPYAYEAFLDPAEDLPELLAGRVATVVGEANDSFPAQFLVNYLNPFNPIAHIYFSLLTTERVTLEIFSAAGQEVATLLDDRRLASGAHHIKWDASGRAAGVYLCRIKTVNYTHTRKMVLVK
jgi:pectate lyase